jgi:transposase
MRTTFPLYRQEQIFGRAGLAIPCSTLGAWVGACGVQLQPLVDALHQEILQQNVLHADETPVQMLSPGKGKTHRAYLWAYTPTQFSDLRAVVYAFADSRAGEHARTFLEKWQGKLVCDDYSGYKASFQQGIAEIGCAAHAQRKLVSEGSAIAKAMDYSLKHWEALTRYLHDGNVPIDNKWVENQIRPWAIGRSNWLFAGSLRAGQRAAAIMSLIRSAQLNGHDPYAYLKDVLTRLPTHRANDVSQLLPYRWRQIETP